MGPFTPKVRLKEGNKSKNNSPVRLHCSLASFRYYTRITSIFLKYLLKSEKLCFCLAN